MKRCPFCNREFKDSLIHCVIDGHKLEPVASEPEANNARPLSEILNKEIPMEVERAVLIAIVLCDALGDLHEAGRIIGDLRPQRLILDDRLQTPEVKILEQEASAGQKAQSSASSYLSPEAAQKQEVDKRSDVYSVGAILYEMLTGQLPFKASSPAALVVKQLLERPPSPRDLRPEISAGLEKVVLRAIEKERSARQQSIRQLKQELKDTASGESTQSRLPATGNLEIASPPGSFEIASPSVSAPPPAPSYSSAPSSVSMPSAPPPFAAQPAGAPAYGAARTKASSKKLIPFALIGLVLVAAVAAVVVLQSNRSANRSERSAPTTATNSNTESETLPPPDAGQFPTGPMPGNPKQTPSQPGPPRPTTPRPGNSNTTTSPPVTSPAPQEGTNPIIWVIVAGIVLAGATTATTLFILSRKSAAAGNRFQPAQSPWIDSRPQSWPRQSDDTAQTVKTPVHAQPSLRESIKRCPSCQSEFPVTGRFCVYDGNSLREEVKVTPPKDSPSFYDLQSLETKKQCPQCHADYAVTTTFCHSDGTRLVEISPAPKPLKQDSDIEPFIIGQYRCFARLGEGGMGMVYKAYHVHLQRLSAVKVLLPQTAIIPDSVRMFRREAQLASSINHPNSVTIYDYGEVGEALFYLAMEFIPGKSLASIIESEDKQPHPLPLSRALNITRQICDALDTAHQMGIIHRDLKPQNVMVNERTNRTDLVKVVDFGIARSMTIPGEYETMPGTVMGTPAYMSPEQARGDVALDARSDIYSLAVMVYQMLSGTLPFPVKGLSLWQQVNQRATLNSPPPSLSEFYPRLNIPYEIDRVLMRALETDRDRRLQSAIEFLDQLEQAARSYNF